MSALPDPSVVHARETKAWAMRARGWSQVRIAAELGLNQSTVSRTLARVERRELARMSRSVERIKAVQSAQFEHIIEESLEAWHRSKTPKKRAARKTASGDQGDGDAIETTEVVERDGDASYLYAAMNAMGGQRSLWGLDVAPALQEPASSIAALAADLFRRGSDYEQRTAKEEGQAGDPSRPGAADPGGAESLQGGLQPVQRDDLVPGSVLEPPGGDLP